jgi:hypothetical protein
MSNGLRHIQRKGGLAGRTFERAMGCWNCKHFDRGAASRKFWNEVAEPRDVEVGIQLVALGRVHEAKELSERIKVARKAVKLGMLGLCTARPKRVETDYVAHNYLCEGWTGAQGASIAREGAKADLLPGEIKEIVDGNDDLPPPTLVDADGNPLK